MVPHRRALQAIILAAHGHREPDNAVSRWMETWKVRCPVPWRDFARTQIFPFIASDLEILITTTDFSLSGDFRPILAAAKMLEVQSFVQVGAEGTVLYLPATVEKWRTNPTMLSFLETSMCCEVPIAQLVDDFRRIYATDVGEADMLTFQRLFVDPEYLNDDGWVNYQRCISPDEAQRRQRLRLEPKDFVRWKLGVPVQLDTDTVLRRVISDAYYTERLLKHEAGDGGLRVSKDTLTRMKLERDTLFKGVKMLEELATAKGGGATDGETKKIRDALASLEIERSLPDFPELSDLT